MKTKLCPNCNVEKPHSDYWIRRDRNAPAGRCKECSTAAQRAWRRSKPDYERARYQLVKVETRERHLLRKYGVSLADYDRMLVAQNGNCAICQAPEAEQHNGVFHVDHCHTTGRVRGLLCRGCNHMLGVVGDNPAVLERAITYLSVPQIPELIGRAILESLTPSPQA